MQDNKWGKENTEILKVDDAMPMMHGSVNMEHHKII